MYKRDSNIHSALFYNALETMERNKFETELRPDDIATELGISRRQLFLLFEEHDISFARTLASMRIRAARKLLVSKPRVPVIEIAFSCGFDSIATFYRVFSATYGSTPGRLRSVAANATSLDATTSPKRQQANLSATELILQFQ